MAVVFVIIALDFLLWKTDPHGAIRYLWDYYHLQQHALPSPHGLLYEPGTYRLNMYTVTIGIDGFRAVPTNAGGSCRIAFIGDSMVFGMGSDVSFVDLLAGDMPADVINAAQPGYNIDNIARVPESVPADGYVYLAFFNDSEPPLRWELPSGYPPPALFLYRDYLTSPGGLPVEEDYFEYRAADLFSREDVLVFAFEGLPLTDIAAAHGAVVIPLYTQLVSRYDGHPSPEGAAEIADSMRLAVAVFVEQQCEE